MTFVSLTAATSPGFSSPCYDLDDFTGQPARSWRASYNHSPSELLYVRSREAEETLEAGLRMWCTSVSSRERARNMTSHVPISDRASWSGLKSEENDTVPRASLKGRKLKRPTRHLALLDTIAERHAKTENQLMSLQSAQTLAVGPRANLQTQFYLASESARMARGGPPQSGWGEKIRMAVYERLRCKSEMNGSCDERTQASPAHAARPSMQQPAAVEPVRASAKPAREPKPIRWG
jgi:hypothetical protein